MAECACVRLCVRAYVRVKKNRSASQLTLWNVHLSGSAGTRTKTTDTSTTVASSRLPFSIALRANCPSAHVTHIRYVFLPFAARLTCTRTHNHETRAHTQKTNQDRACPPEIGRNPGTLVRRMRMRPPRFPRIQWGGSSGTHTHTSRCQPSTRNMCANTHAHGYGREIAIFLGFYMHLIYCRMSSARLRQL